MLPKKVKKKPEKMQKNNLVNNSDLKMKFQKFSIILMLLFLPFLFSCNKNVSVKLIEEHDPVVKIIEEHDSLVIIPRDSNKVKPTP